MITAPSGKFRIHAFDLYFFYSGRLYTVRKPSGGAERGQGPTRFDTMEFRHRRPGETLGRVGVPLGKDPQCGRAAVRGTACGGDIHPGAGDLERPRCRWKEDSGCRLCHLSPEGLAQARPHPYGLQVPLHGDSLRSVCEREKGKLGGHRRNDAGNHDARVVAPHCKFHSHRRPHGHPPPRLQLPSQKRRRRRGDPTSARKRTSGR